MAFKFEYKSSGEDTPIKNTPSNFGDAFNMARSEGKKEFAWKGKKYHTGTSEEVYGMSIDDVNKIRQVPTEQYTSDQLKELVKGKEHIIAGDQKSMNDWNDLYKNTLKREVEDSYKKTIQNREEYNKLPESIKIGVDFVRNNPDYFKSQDTKEDNSLYNYYPKQEAFSLATPSLQKKIDTDLKQFEETKRKKNEEKKFNDLYGDLIVPGSDFKYDPESQDKLSKWPEPGSREEKLTQLGYSYEDINEKGADNISDARIDVAPNEMWQLTTGGEFDDPLSKGKVDFNNAIINVVTPIPGLDAVPIIGSSKLISKAPNLFRTYSTETLPFVKGLADEAFYYTLRGASSIYKEAKNILNKTFSEPKLEWSFPKDAFSKDISTDVNIIKTPKQDISEVIKNSNELNRSTPMIINSEEAFEELGKTNITSDIAEEVSYGLLPNPFNTVKNISNEFIGKSKSVVSGFKNEEGKLSFETAKDNFLSHLKYSGKSFLYPHKYKKISKDFISKAYGRIQDANILTYQYIKSDVAKEKALLSGYTSKEWDEFVAQRIDESKIYTSSIPKEHDRYIPKNIISEAASNKKLPILKLESELLSEVGPKTKSDIFPEKVFSVDENGNASFVVNEAPFNEIRKGLLKSSGKGDDLKGLLPNKRTKGVVDSELSIPSQTAAFYDPATDEARIFIDKVYQAGKQNSLSDKQILDHIFHLTAEENSHLWFKNTENFNNQVMMRMELTKKGVSVEDAYKVSLDKSYNEIVPKMINHEREAKLAKYFSKPQEIHGLLWRARLNAGKLNTGEPLTKKDIRKYFEKTYSDYFDKYFNMEEFLSMDRSVPKKGNNISDINILDEVYRSSKNIVDISEKNVNSISNLLDDKSSLAQGSSKWLYNSMKSEEGISRLENYMSGLSNDSKDYIKSYMKDLNPSKIKVTDIDDVLTKYHSFINSENNSEGEILGMIFPEVYSIKRANELIEYQQRRVTSLDNLLKEIKDGNNYSENYIKETEELYEYEKSLLHKIEIKRDVGNAMIDMFETGTFISNKLDDPMKLSTASVHESNHEILYKLMNDKNASKVVDVLKRDIDHVLDVPKFKSFMSNAIDNPQYKEIDQFLFKEDIDYLSNSTEIAARMSEIRHIRYIDEGTSLYDEFSEEWFNNRIINDPIGTGLMDEGLAIMMTYLKENKMLKEFSDLMNRSFMILGVIAGSSLINNKK